MNRQGIVTTEHIRRCHAADVADELVQIMLRCGCAPLRLYLDPSGVLGYFVGFNEEREKRIFGASSLVGAYTMAVTRDQIIEDILTLQRGRQV